MAKSLVLSLLILLVAGTAQATTFDLAFNNESAQVELGQPIIVDELGASEVGARFLYNDAEETRLGSLGLLFTGEPGNVPGLKLGIGAQGYLGSTDRDQDLLAAAVGGTVRYAPPALGGVAMLGKLYFAPRIFSGLDCEQLWETEVRAGYNLTPRVQVHLGYQAIRSEFDSYDTWTIDDAIRLGFQASF